MLRAVLHRGNVKFVRCKEFVLFGSAYVELHENCAARHSMQPCINASLEPRANRIRFKNRSTRYTECLIYAIIFERFFSLHTKRLLVLCPKRSFQLMVLPMIARRQHAEAAVTKKPLVLEEFSREAPMIAARLDCPEPKRLDPAGRKLRNRIILANTFAWFVIILLIRMIFF